MRPQEHELRVISIYGVWNESDKALKIAVSATNNVPLTSLVFRLTCSCYISSPEAVRCPSHERSRSLAAVRLESTEGRMRR